jgi:excisionase family DNA binding protein
MVARPTSTNVTPTPTHAAASSGSFTGSPAAEILHRLAALEARLDDWFSRRGKSHLTVEEFAGAVGRSPYTTRKWISQGKIRAVRVSGTGPRGRYLIARAELERVVADGRGAAVPDAMID